MSAPAAQVVGPALGAVPGAGTPPRDFTYVRPRRRRLSEYEAVTCFAQPDIEMFDGQGWFLRGAGGRTAWEKSSTALVHPNWFAFRDPAAQWQRTYVRMQAEQERAIDRAIEDAAARSGLADIDPGWLRDILGRHYRAWSYVEYGLFRAFAVGQRESLSDTLGNVYAFEAFDRMRHAQDIVLHLMDIEANVSGFVDDGAKGVWLNDASYQPARHIVEDLMCSNDWAQLGVVTNLVFDPIVTEIAVSTVVGGLAPRHGDAVTAHLVGTTERDRRRNLAWTEELVRMVTAEDVPERDANRATISGWVRDWTPRALAAAEALRAVHDTVPLPARGFDETLAAARRGQSALVAALDLDVEAAE